MHNRLPSFLALVRSVPFILLLILTAGPQLSAQHRRGIRETSNRESRSGFWGLIGLGMGAQAIKPDGASSFSSILYQPTATLRVGGTVSSSLRLGVEGFAWIDAAGDRVESLASLMLMGQFYPIKSAGLFIKGGAGLGRSGIDTSDGFSAADIGFATSLGAGAELRMGRYLYVVPSVDWVYHTYQNKDAPGYRARVVNFGVALLFQG